MGGGPSRSAKNCYPATPTPNSYSTVPQTKKRNSTETQLKLLVSIRTNGGGQLPVTTIFLCGNASAQRIASICQTHHPDSLLVVRWIEYNDPTTRPRRSPHLQTQKAGRDTVGSLRRQRDREYSPSQTKCGYVPIPERRAIEALGTSAKIRSFTTQYHPGQITGNETSAPSSTTSPNLGEPDLESIRHFDKHISPKLDPTNWLTAPDHRKQFLHGVTDFQILST